MMIEHGNLVVADFNRDNILDVAVSTFTGVQPEIVVLFGRGDGTFGDPQVLDQASGTGGLVVADFNGDNIPDLAASLFQGIEVLLGRGDGTFDAPLIRPLTSRANKIAAADFDGDGKIDDVVSHGLLLASPEQPVTITVLRGNGNGTFGDEQILPVGTRPSFIAIGDFNLDKRPDLAVANSGGTTVSVLINESSSKR